MGDAWSELIPDFRNTETVEEARNIVLNGIRSNDPQTVEEMVHQIGWIAMMATLEDFMPAISDDFAVLPPRRERLRRQFASVPELRGTLIDFAKNAIEQDALGQEQPLGQAPYYDSNSQIPQPETWAMAWFALAAFFPQDPVVHDLFVDRWKRGAPASAVVALLYTGRFRSTAADEIRVAALEAGAPSTVAAAKGLALSGSDSALAALVAGLHRRDFALLTIVEAIASFGSRVTPHVARLVELGHELEAHVADEDDPFALYPWRIRSITRTIAELSAQFGTVDGD